jgi:hypothetical protein
MAIIDLRQKSQCKYDILSLGEIMIRLDPGQERIHTTRHFRVWEGGGEYNVARGLKRCFGQRAAVVTALVDNPVGRLLEDLMYQGGVSMEYVKWFPYDGIGRKVRIGLNFTERGYGVRAALSDHTRCYHRGRHGSEKARHYSFLRPEFPQFAVERYRRPGKGDGSQPGYRAARRCHARKRRRFHSRSGF